MNKKSLPLIALSFIASLARADAALQSFLEQTLNDARAKANLPAVAALVQIDGKVEAQAAIGLRAIGQDAKVTLDDQWHLGSDTKAMTATLIARLVEQHTLRFDDTMAKLFPGLAAGMNPQLHDATVEQLLTHTSGLPALTSGKELIAFNMAIGEEKGLRAQRAAMVEYYLRRKPVSKPGEFSYSNIGYAILGAIAEERTGKGWEELIRREIWKPLGIKSGGFGPPGRSRRATEPMGHEMRNGKWVALNPRDADSDNPPAIGPAGTVHMSLADWRLFAQDQLDGELGHGKLLRPESYHRLHTPMTKNYAMGWGVLRDKDGNLQLLQHTGSNGYWIADVRIVPKRNLVLLTTINAGGPEAEKADKSIGLTLQDHLQALE